MPRKKKSHPEQVLSHPIIIRLTKAGFERLEALQKQSDCASVGEVARRILTNRKIKVYQKDVSMNAPMEEMALIRKELKAIGVNINQITRTFNQDKQETRRAFYVLKTADLYQHVDAKVERLLTLISKLAEKWLQK